MKVVAFGGSTSKESINKEFAKFAMSYFSDYEQELIDLNTYPLPLYSIDLEKQGFPDAVKKFIEKLKQTDVIICSSSEHNKDLTAAFKNILDWSSRVELKFLTDKPVLLLSTSPGGYGGKNSLDKSKAILESFGAKIPVTFSLPKFKENFEIGSGISNPDLKQEFEGVISQFKATL